MDRPTHPGRRKLLSATAIGAAVCVLAGASLLNASPSVDDRNQASTRSTGETALDPNGEIRNLPAPLRSLLADVQWVNTPPLRVEDLRGKVVLVNFWTYSCINSLRPLPYLRAWADKYRDRGLVVIGVHTPEFAFEHDLSKVRTMVAELPVGYPVMLDNDYDVWRTFDNNAWPGFYFVDAKGRVRHRTLGENGYAESEQWIQKLLAEASGTPVSEPLSRPSGEGAEAPPDWRNLRTPETYVGYARAENFSSPGGAKRDASVTYRAGSRLTLNHWGLSGKWTIGREYASLDGAAGKIAYRFHARDLHLVLGRAEASAPIRFRVTLDGQEPGGDHGADTDAEGWGTLDQDRMYQLIRQSGAVTDRTFEIEFFAPGARAYAFTFG